MRWTPATTSGEWWVSHDRVDAAVDIRRPVHADRAMLDGGEGRVHRAQRQRLGIDVCERQLRVAVQRRRDDPACARAVVEDAGMAELPREIARDVIRKNDSCPGRERPGPDRGLDSSNARTGDQTRSIHAPGSSSGRLADSSAGRRRRAHHVSAQDYDAGRTATTIPTGPSRSIRYPIRTREAARL